MTHSTLSLHARSEFFRDHGWRVVVAAAVGVAFGLTALPFYTLGIFAKSLAAEFGWGRTVIQSGITAAMFGVVCSAWLVGWLIDRFGARPVALASQVGLALGFVGLAAQTGETWLWPANWFVMAVLGVGTTPLTWSRGIASWFVEQRGLALGFALTGTGLTALAGPPLIAAVVGAHGWRIGYLVIALAIVLVALPMVWLYFHEKPAAPAPAGAAQGAAAMTGLTLAEALRGRRFWLLIVAFGAVSAAVTGVIPNLVPLLTDGGLDMTTAAGYASLLGLNVIAGRLLAGWLLDRFWGPAVALALLAPPALACLLLASHQWPGLAVALIGLAGGAEFDLLAYLCLRYFGTRQYGQIYAWQWAAFALASGGGPIAFGMVFDHTGSYQVALYAAAALMVGGAVLLLGMGRYPRL